MVCPDVIDVAPTNDDGDPKQKTTPSYTKDDSNLDPDLDIDGSQDGGMFNKVPVNENNVKNPALRPK